MPDLTRWPAWGAPLAWTLLTLAASWAIGRFLGTLVMARVPRWVPENRRALVHSSASIVRRRVPRWCLLVGCWMAAGYWPLTAEGHFLVARVVFVLAAASVTLTTARSSRRRCP
jgi:hypothetical protein